MNALRLCEGTSVQTFTDRTDLAWPPSGWQQLARDELVDPNRPVTTPLGFRYLDTVLSRLLER